MDQEKDKVAKKERELRKLLGSLVADADPEVLYSDFNVLDKKYVWSSVKSESELESAKYSYSFLIRIPIPTFSESVGVCVIINCALVTQEKYQSAQR